MIGTIEKWLREGTVDLKVTRINMHGASGAGKTCTQLLLLNEPPPDSVTDSTPVACPAVQATRVSIDDDNQKMKWKRVTPAELLDQLASDLKEAPKVVSQLSVKEGPKKTKTHEQNERKDEPLHHSDEEAQKESLDATKKVNEDTGERVDEPLHQSNDETQEVSTDATKKVVEGIAKSITDGTKAKLSTNWAYFIDSGGQPAYRELLPLFTRTAALNIITIDLTKGLEKEFESEYRTDEKTSPNYTGLKYSNLDIIRSTISSEAILKPIEVPYVTKTPDHPHYLVIGTRKKEVEEKDINSINLMNQTLKNSNLNLQHVIWKVPQKSIIFPVDTLLPADSKEREEASIKLCKVISNCNVSMTIKMPIRLFVFEIALQAEAKEKKRSFLTKKEVFDIGKSLQLDDEKEVEKALQYLHNVTIILYYHDFLEDLVFVNPQPILDVLSQLIAITYIKPDPLDSIAKSPSQDDINLTTSGCFKEELLKNVGTSVSEHDQLKSHDMIKLLLHLNIIAEVKNKEEGDYFFPCALPSYNEKESPPPSTEIKPLLVVWKNDDDKILPVPQGVFPLIVVHLLNQEVSYEVNFPPSDPNYYKCYNAMSLHVQVPKQSPKQPTLHIINRYTHIELYFEGDKKHCPKIWELVNEAIKSSSNGIYAEQSYARAFKCPKGTKEKYCYCIVRNKSSTKCTECTSSYDILPKDDSYWCWVHDSQSGK